MSQTPTARLGRNRLPTSWARPQVARVTTLAGVLDSPLGATRAWRVSAAVVASLLLLSACASVEGDDIGSPIFNGTTPEGDIVNPPITTLPIPEVDAIRVPFDHFSVQAAIDSAQPGDLILLDPGVYSEEVVVDVSDIVIRGRDRNTVFIDGLHSATTGFRVQADGVAIENMTVRNYLEDAIIVDASTRAVPIDGFRALHVTTSNTGRHGIALNNVRNAEISQVWVSGHGDTGVRIENCADCATTVETTLAEFSAHGFVISGAERGAAIVRSTSRNNRVGVLVEDGARQTVGAIVGGSVVLNNGFANSPSADPAADHAFGVGIHVSGSFGTQVLSNRVSGNTRVGVLIGTNRFGEDAVAVETAVEGNEIAEHPEGTTITTREWSSTDHGSIPYENGPVPPGIEGLPNADSDLPIPAGPILSVDVAGLVVPAA